VIPQCAYFKTLKRALANQLQREQLEDGGWNREAVAPLPKRPKSPRSSFHDQCFLARLIPIPF